MDPAYRILVALNQNDYVKALYIYSEILQRVLTGIVLFKNKHGVVQHLCDLIRGETDAHAIILNTLHYLIQASSHPKLKFPTTTDLSVGIDNLTTNKQAEEFIKAHGTYLFIPPNFNRFFSKVLTLSIGDSTAADWSTIFENITNQYVRVNLGVANDAIWFKQLELIIAQARALSRIRDQQRMAVTTQRLADTESEAKHIRDSDDRQRGNETEMMHMRKSISELELSVRQRDEMIRQRDADLNALADKNTELVSQIYVRDERIRSGISQLQELNDGITESRFSMKERDEQIQHENNRLQTLMVENTQLKSSIHERDQLIQQSNAELQALNRTDGEFQRGKKQLQTLMEENIQLKTTVLERDQRIQQSSAELQTLIEKNTQLNNSILERDNAIKQCDAELQAFKSWNRERDGKFQRADDALRGTEMENRRLESSMKESERLFQNQKSELENKREDISKLNNNIARMDEQNKYLTEELNRCKAEMGQKDLHYKQQVEQLKAAETNRISETESLISSLKMQHKRESMVRDNQNYETQKALRTLKEEELLCRLNEITIQNERLGHNVSTLQKQVSDFEEQKINNKQEVDVLKNRLKERENEITIVNTRLHEMNTTFRIKEEQIESSQKETIRMNETNVNSLREMYGRHIQKLKEELDTTCQKNTANSISAVLEKADIHRLIAEWQMKINEIINGKQQTINDQARTIQRADNELREREIALNSQQEINIVLKGQLDAIRKKFENEKQSSYQYLKNIREKEESLGVMLSKFNDTQVIDKDNYNVNDEDNDDDCDDYCDDYNNDDTEVIKEGTIIDNQKQDTSNIHNILRERERDLDFAKETINSLHSELQRLRQQLVTETQSNSTYLKNINDKEEALYIMLNNLTYHDDYDYYDDDDATTPATTYTITPSDLPTATVTTTTTTATSR